MTKRTCKHYSQSADRSESACAQCMAMHNTLIEASGQCLADISDWRELGGQNSFVCFLQDGCRDCRTRSGYHGEGTLAFGDDGCSEVR